MTARIFGRADEHPVTLPREAAYAVIRKAGSIAAVRNGSTYFLPGGGSQGQESPMETITREVAEELECEIEIAYEIGRAVQYFYSNDDETSYRMEATFYSARLASEPRGEVFWVAEAVLKNLLYHECHRWAIEASAVKIR
jgi:8-oxo-dGTP pyrophosphatase MutT (NUDIX family)